jgi:outer membrane protein
MKMYGRKLAMITGVVLLGWCGSVSAADLKVAYVDINKAVNECYLGKEAQKNMVKEAEKVHRQMTDKQKELQTMKESYEKQALMLTPEARAIKEKEFQTKVREFERWQEDVRNELNQKRADMQRNIFTGLQKVIQKIGADEGYSLILESGLLLYGSKSLDITDRVIKTFDAQKK